MSQTNSSAPKQSKVHPTSPWTEVFQQSQAAATPSSDRAQSAERANTPRAAESDAVRPTRDALSVIFKQD